MYTYFSEALPERPNVKNSTNKKILNVLIGIHVKIISSIKYKNPVFSKIRPVLKIRLNLVMYKLVYKTALNQIIYSIITY